MPIRTGMAVGVPQEGKQTYLIEYRCDGCGTQEGEHIAGEMVGDRAHCTVCNRTVTVQHELVYAETTSHASRDHT